MDYKLIFTLLLILTTLTSCVPSNMQRVVTDSMEPTIKKGSLVITREVLKEDIKVGDIVMFHTSTMRNPIISRIVSINRIDNTFSSKADNNKASLSFERDVSLDLILGKIEIKEDNKFVVSLYCEKDSDCTLQEDTCCGHPINIYNYQEIDESELNPKCKTQCIPIKFQSLYCNQDASCSIKLNCDDCDSINEFMEQIGCFQDHRPVQSINACENLVSCDCELN